MKYAAFLRWWLYFVLTCLGGAAAYGFGLLNLVNEADFTKISFLIYGLFLGFSIYTGVNTHRACKVTGDSGPIPLLYRRNESGWFMADQLLSLGMVGTVIGFIYMLSTSFAELNLEVITSMQAALTKLGAGMSTALYTTAVGLICSLLLKLQLFNLSQHLDGLKEECKDSASSTCVVS